MDVFKLSRNWFDWCFENPELISPNHSALYFFAIEHCNRLGWKEKFGLPTEMAKAAIGIKNYRTYYNTFSDLVEWGFFKIIQKSKNQYSANIIAIAENTKAHTKALTKATHLHSQKQSLSIVDIDIPNTLLPETNTYIRFDHFVLTVKEFDNLIAKGWTKEQIDKTIDAVRNYAKNKNYKDLNLTLQNWMQRDYGKPNTTIPAHRKDFVS